MPWRGFKIIITCTFVGVFLGGIVGWMLGVAAPGFCMSVIPVLNDYHTTDGAHQIGLGLGVANGVIYGLIAGVALVIAEAIKYLKKPET